MSEITKKKSAITATEAAKVAEVICSSGNLEIYRTYINEVFDRCRKLAKMGENECCKNEIKFMLLTLLKIEKEK